MAGVRRGNIFLGPDHIMNFFTWSGDCIHVTNPTGRWKPCSDMSILFVVHGQLCSAISAVPAWFCCAVGCIQTEKHTSLNPCQNWFEISRNWASVVKAPGPEGQWKRGILPESSVLIKTHAFSGAWHGVRCQGQKEVDFVAKTAAGNILVVYGGIFVLYLLGHTYSCKFYLDSGHVNWLASAL